MQFSEFPVQSLMYITNRPETVFTHGKGSWIFDHTGKRYLDFIQGWAVNCLGHCNEGMIRALTEQAGKLINPSPAYYNEPMARLAGLLTKNSCFDKVFFTNSGAEANEGAIKLARKWGQKHPNAAGGARFEIITFDHSFHGRTLATMSASGKPGWDKIFAPQVPGFPKAELNDIASVEKLIGPDTVAVMLEPVQGEGGVIPATREFMLQLRELTHRHNLLLIVDEVQTGCGRTGKLFAYELSGITPDIMTLGKGIGGGVPLAALLSTAAVAVFEAGDQGGTYNGNPLMTAVGISVIEQLTAPGFLENVTQLGNYLREQLLALCDTYGFEGERGEGLLRALLLGKDIGPQIVEKARNLSPDGLLVNAARPNLLRFMPALNVTREEIDQMIAMLKTVLAQVG
ncbi:acetylornithine aminotransferase [Pandoraea thiooxydans]|uniref:Acetylornithine aminotransferase n=1 Tax=Pandoraea thiooxydans TaxID=445709 RepID=A0A0G3EXJ1_9BURK|nr:acetylornithine transaminase [Pandoraea thiooxydans]AKJ70117.1 acetylornithine transaminase [Pandoraea thiooxydans]APR93549.1 acetylornithine aminotransferase [Pandoraea thiooxydans]